MTQFSNNTEEKKRGYDLEERTAKFGEDVIVLCQRIKHTPVITPLINQLVRSATSVGANYMEANGASSKRDFRNKIFICKKEAGESKHWLRMLKTAVPDLAVDLKKLWQEAQELTLIFQKIAKSSGESSP